MYRKQAKEFLNSAHRCPLTQRPRRSLKFVFFHFKQPIQVTTEKKTQRTILREVGTATNALGRKTQVESPAAQLNKFPLVHLQ